MEKAQWQSPEEVARDRAQLCPQGQASEESNYLLVAGVRHPVPFRTRVFDAVPQLRYDASLPHKERMDAAIEELTGLLTALRKAPVATLRAWWGGAPRLAEAERWLNFVQQGRFLRHARPRHEPTGSGVDAVVLHWDKCNSSAQCLAVLRQRGLSAHLLLQDDGTVLQTLDLAHTTAFHAGWINERSIGIEINNPVDVRVDALLRAQRPKVRQTLAHGAGTGELLDFTAAQKHVLPQLVRFLCARFAVPKLLPPSVDGNGEEATPRLMPRDFRGICGHYHVSAHKLDPGLSLWPVLAASWAAADEAAVDGAAVHEAAVHP